MNALEQTRLNFAAIAASLQVAIAEADKLPSWSSPTLDDEARWQSAYLRFIIDQEEASA